MIEVSFLQLFTGWLLAVAFGLLCLAIGWLGRGDRDRRRAFAQADEIIRLAKEDEARERSFGPRFYNVVRISDWKPKRERDDGLFGGQPRGVA